MLGVVGAFDECEVKTLMTPAIQMLSSGYGQSSSEGHWMPREGSGLLPIHPVGCAP